MVMPKGSKVCQWRFVSLHQSTKMQQVVLWHQGNKIPAGPTTKFTTAQSRNRWVGKMNFIWYDFRVEIWWFIDVSPYMIHRPFKYKSSTKSGNPERTCVFFSQLDQPVNLPLHQTSSTGWIAVSTYSHFVFWVEWISKNPSKNKTKEAKALCKLNHINPNSYGYDVIFRSFL